MNSIKLNEFIVEGLIENQKKTIYLLAKMLVITIRSKSIQHDDDVVTTAPFTSIFDKFLLFNIDFEAI
jgi:hypothetical protein